jgi:hypothetical protein
MLVSCSNSELQSSTSTAAVSTSHSLTGVLTVEKIDLFVESESEIGGGCIAPPGFTNIRENLQVLLKDDSGNIISVSRLGGEHPTFAKILEVRQDRGVKLGTLSHDT